MEDRKRRPPDHQKRDEASPARGQPRQDDETKTLNVPFAGAGDKSSGGSPTPPAGPLQTLIAALFAQPIIVKAPFGLALLLLLLWLLSR